VLNRLNAGVAVRAPGIVANIAGYVAFSFLVQARLALTCVASPLTEAHVWVWAALAVVALVAPSAVTSVTVPEVNSFLLLAVFAVLLRASCHRAHPEFVIVNTTIQAKYFVATVTATKKQIHVVSTNQFGAQVSQSRVPK
jgi:hypothetical protein